MMTTQRVTDGEFKVLWNGQPTLYKIINGGGADAANKYGITTRNGKPVWVGSWDSAKKLVAHWLTMKRATIFKNVQSPAEIKKQRRSDKEAEGTEFSERFQQRKVAPPTELDECDDEGFTPAERECTKKFSSVIAELLKDDDDE